MAAAADRRPLELKAEVKAGIKAGTAHWLAAAERARDHQDEEEEEEEEEEAATTTARGPHPSKGLERRNSFSSGLRRVPSLGSIGSAAAGRLMHRPSAGSIPQSSPAGRQKTFSLRTARSEATLADGGDDLRT